MSANSDAKTIEDFGREWNRYDQSQLDARELQELFNRYFKIFPMDTLSKDSVGFDMGCGSGRWAKLVAPHVGTLYCIDASEMTLNVARRNLRSHANCQFMLAPIDKIPLQNDSVDFGYCLGVLHHIPDTAAGLKACVDKLKPGAPFLLYIYYDFDNRPRWFRRLWRLSDTFRRSISICPFPTKYRITQAIAFFIYYPLARFALLMEKFGYNVDAFPLSTYRYSRFYSMRTDALDRFGTRLEKRFTARQIRRMMEQAGLKNILFSDSAPYWCAVGYKAEKSD